MGKKILLLGRAGVGKSTLKGIIFEGRDPDELLIQSLPPTRGIETSVYPWLDLELSVFDTSGQELKSLLEDKSEQLLAFGGVDIVIYIFDYEIWHSDSEEISDEINEVNQIMKKVNKQAQLVLILHKIDLIPKAVRNNTKIFLHQIQYIVNLPIKYSIYFTSIEQDYLYNIHNAFSEIISKFSEKNFSLKKSLDNTIMNFSECICYITDYNDSIIVQSKSDDFNISLIYESYRIFYYLSRDNKVSIYNDGIQHLLNVDDKILRMLIVPLEAPNLNLKLLVVATESFEEGLLYKLAKKILVNLKVF
jgi:GTPase SAR1 family protein